MESSIAPRLQLTGITKRFPGVLANDNVSFSVRPGEIHALLGENGAGKSTLVKMIYGIMQPDAGEIRWNGQPLTVSNPKAARKLGIGMVFQHFSLFEAMTVLENIALGMDSKIQSRDLEAKIREVMEQYGLKLEPHRVVSTLSVGERQRIEIVRALLLNPKLLIMDEPTSVLTPQEVEQLFVVLRQLAAEGCSILYISHKLHEIKALCDTATILRGGKLVDTCDPKVETSRSMAEKMIGAGLKDVRKVAGRTFGAEKLVVKGLSHAATSHFGTSLKGISFSVRAGEILGIAGVAGNGQLELLLALDGELGTDPQSVSIDGKPAGALSPTARRALGLCAVPEERNGHAAIADFSLADNTVLTARDRLGMVSGGLIRAGAARTYTGEVIAAFAVKALGPGATAGSLSGGNLQKYIMGREIMQKPSVLVVSQPTWGVDAGAAAAIHQAIVDLAATGTAVVVISQDLDELLALSDTLAVINGGRLSAPMAVGSVSIEEIGLLMGGIHGTPEETHLAPGASLQLRLEKRAAPSRFMLYATPVAAVLITMVLGALIFTLLGYDGLGAVREIFFTPLTNPYKWQDLAVKASPLVIIAVGLAVSYRANVWNIGAEGQYIVGGIAGTGVALLTYDMTGPWILPLMLLAGIAGGAAYAAIPAFLRTQYKVNEILTTLMLTYVSVQLLNYLVFGPWKSPTSMGQPQTVLFSADQSLPYVIPGTIVQLGTPIAILVALLVWFVMSRSVFGFQIRVVGASPAAARYGGFSANRTVWLALLVSGGLAGLAGILEAAGPFGRLVPQFPTNYGFTAIIVAFLGRLNPLGALLAGIVLAITFVGGEVAQTTIALPFAAVGIFQAMMLFLLLAGDVLVRYRIRRVANEPARASA